mmetsp:Transcript_453/g.1019  ORF Transcript_453/g.1019 Transcript_453/m.1019 type:complete len:105 (-) Transcript_453:1003-1317(-)
MKRNCRDSVVPMPIPLRASHHHAIIMPTMEQSTGQQPASPSHTQDQRRVLANLTKTPTQAFDAPFRANTSGLFSNNDVNSSRQARDNPSSRLPLQENDISSFST